MLLLSAETAGAGYTKIANSGSELPASATLGSAPGDWACTRDDATGLVWEVKADDGGTRDWGRLYTNYDSSSGTPDQVRDATNSLGFVSAVNGMQLCGFINWRLPTKNELWGLISPAQPMQAQIDATFFPNTERSLYWSSTPGFSVGTLHALDFGGAAYATLSPTFTGRVRLVRGRQTSDYFPVLVAVTGAGAGQVAVDGVNCAHAGTASTTLCAIDRGVGSTVTLTASPATGSSFAGWGGACGGDLPCVLTLNATKAVTARFSSPAVTNIAVSAVSPGTLYSVVEDNGIYRSSDGGVQWTVCATQPGAVPIHSLVLSGSSLYAGTAGGVFVSNDACASWTALNNGLPN